MVRTRKLGKLFSVSELNHRKIAMAEEIVSETYQLGGVDGIDLIAGRIVTALHHEFSIGPGEFRCMTFQQRTHWVEIDTGDQIDIALQKTLKGQFL